MPMNYSGLHPHLSKSAVLSVKLDVLNILAFLEKCPFPLFIIIIILLSFVEINFTVSICPSRLYCSNVEIDHGFILFTIS